MVPKTTPTPAAFSAGSETVGVWPRALSSRPISLSRSSSIGKRASSPSRALYARSRCASTRGVPGLISASGVLSNRCLRSAIAAQQLQLQNLEEVGRPILRQRMPAGHGDLGAFVQAELRQYLPDKGVELFEVLEMGTHDRRHAPVKLNPPRDVLRRRESKDRHGRPVLGDEARRVAGLGKGDDSMYFGGRGDRPRRVSDREGGVRGSIGTPQPVGGVEELAIA